MGCLAHTQEKKNFQAYHSYIYKVLAKGNKKKNPLMQGIPLSLLMGMYGDDLIIGFKTVFRSWFFFLKKIDVI